MTDVFTQSVTNAGSTKTFDLMAFTRGRSLVKEELPLYLDEDATYHLQRVIEASGVDVNSDDFEPTEEMKELMERVRATKIVLHLRGLDPIAHEAMRTKYRAESELPDADEGAAGETYFRDKFRHMLIKTTGPDGQDDEHQLSIEEAGEFLDRLPVGQSMILVRTLESMEIASAVLAESVGPDFWRRA